MNLKTRKEIQDWIQTLQHCLYQSSKEIEQMKNNIDTPETDNRLINWLEYGEEIHDIQKMNMKDFNFLKYLNDDERRCFYRKLDDLIRCYNEKAADKL